MSSNQIADSSPTWLNRDYLEGVLREKYNDQSININQMRVEPAVEKGEHFVSAIYRISLVYNTSKSDVQEISYIAKTRFEDKERQSFTEAIETFDVFTHEMRMYSRELPKIKAQLASIGRNLHLVPDTIQIDPKKSCLLFEDLCHSHYASIGKRVGLDLAHAKLALRRVAEFHAAGAKLNELESGATSRTFTRNCFTDDTLAPFFTSQIEACGQAVQNWKGYEQYGQKLLRIAPKVMEYGRKLFAPQMDHFNTLIHADFWINNMLFSYGKDKIPNDVVLIDFQFNCWTSPTIDLHYFLQTSLNDETRWNYQDELVQYYHYHLADTLKALKFQGKIPNYQEFQSQYSDKGFNAVTSVCIVVPLILNEKNQGNDNLMENDEDAMNSKTAVFNQPRIRNILQKLIPIFDQKGVLDPK